MQTYSEIFWSDLYTSGKKKKAKQDRHYCSFLWQGLLTPSDQRYHCKLYKQPSHRWGVRIPSLAPIKATIRRVTATDRLTCPIHLRFGSKALTTQASADWKRSPAAKQLFTKHFAVAFLRQSCLWLTALAQPGQAGTPEPELVLLVRRVTDVLGTGVNAPTLHTTNL